MTQSIVYIAGSTPSDFENHDQGSDVNTLGTATTYNGDSYELVSISRNTDATKMDVMKLGMTKMLSDEYGVSEASHTQKQADLVNAMNWMNSPDENKFYIPVAKDDAVWFTTCFSHTIGGDKTVNDLEKYDDNYYKVVLDFANDIDTPKEGELADLKSFKDIIDEMKKDSKEIGEKLGPDMLTLYVFAKEYLAAHPNTEDAGGTISDFSQYDVFTGATGAKNELPNPLLGWLPEAKVLRDAMGADEYARFIQDDTHLGMTSYGYYNDTWFGTDDTTVVTLDELLELCGKSTDWALDSHLGKKKAAVNIAANDLLTYLNDHCQIEEFNYTTKDVKRFAITVLREDTNNYTATITDENNNVCVLRHDATDNPEMICFNANGERDESLLSLFPVKEIIAEYEKSLSVEN